MPTYSCPLDDGIDLVVSRKTTQKEEWLVMLATQGQAYFKDIATGKVARITGVDLQDFFRAALSRPATNIDAEHLYRDEGFKFRCSWLSTLTEKGRKFYVHLAELLEDENWPVVAKSANFDLAKEWHSINGSYAYSVPSILKDRAQSSKIVKSWGKTHRDQTDEAKEAYAKLVAPIADKVTETFGTDRGRLWIDAAWDAALYVPNDNEGPKELAHSLAKALRVMTNERLRDEDCSLYRSFRHREQSFSAEPPDRFVRIDVAGKRCQRPHRPVNVDFKKFCDWTCQEHIRQGYAERPETFWELWADCLAMEVLVYGDVTDKWPKELLSTHDILAQEAAWLKRDDDPSLERAADERLSVYDWRSQRLKALVCHPRTAEDIRAEARAQSSCLASYIDPVLMDQTDICFLRHSDAADSSWVTIEVDPKRHQVTQALGRFNEEPGKDAWSAIEAWAKAKDLGIAPLRARMEKALNRKVAL